MEKGFNEDKDWRLFTSEDMNEGYKKLKRRKRKTVMGKENQPPTHQRQPSKPSTHVLSNGPSLDQTPPTSLQRSPLSEISNIDHRQYDLKRKCMFNHRKNTPHTPASVNFSSLRSETSTGKSTLCNTANTFSNQNSKGRFSSLHPETSRTLFTESEVFTEDDSGHHFNEPESNIFDGPWFTDDDDDSDYSPDSEISEDEVSVPEGLHSDEDEDADLNLGTEHVKKWSSKRVVPDEYATLGGPSVKCIHCNALMWKEERVNKNVTKGTAIFSLCCRKGEVKLPPSPKTPEYLMHLYTDEVKSPDFHRSIRIYNSMFSFTSTGGNVDHAINNGGAPYIYRLNGQNHHLFGSLIPNNGDDPKFCQLYIYDTANEVSNRMRWVNLKDSEVVDVDVVQGLIRMLDETNELVKEFRTRRDRFEMDDIVDLDITLKVCRAQSGRENHIAPSDDVAGIIVGESNSTVAERDIIIHSYKEGLERISYVHPKLMALQYPMLFPDGEDGFHNKIPFQRTSDNQNKKQEKISMKDYYSYKFQIRDNEGMTPRLGGRLFQQYMVDAFSCIEQTRLWWYRINQTTLRNELYSNICASLRKGNSDANSVGKGVILPSSYVGSKRYMQENFQDALAVCRHVGHPDVFLTMTTNTFWDEIQRMMLHLPHCKVENCPDIISRVFKMKLDQLTNDIKKNSHFGKCVGVMYVVEFQKRGLPHVHMLIWLDKDSKMYLKQNVDKFVSTEIPDPIKDPLGHAAVKQFMMHGPCGLQNPKSPCMKKFKCIRHFPKAYSPRTIFDDSGFPVYMRRKQNVTVRVKKADLDNQWVVPYNRDLLVKYQCHMNIEICCHARSLKYLFKYCLKGHDTATVEVSGRRKKNRNATTNEEEVDEINAYFNGRYVCGCEAAYRIFGFPIHYRTISVERLPFHLPGERNCTFHQNASLEKVAAREKHRNSKLEAFFELNAKDSSARDYTYDAIPKYYVWDDGHRTWNRRKRGFQIGRIAYTHYNTGEPWYLRMLLTKVKGPTSYESLRTVNGVIYNTFREACHEYGLLDDDKEWHEVMTQCCNGGLGPQVRQLFVHIIVNCKVTDLAKLWSCHWKSMVDDILLKRRRLNQNQQLILNDRQLEFYALAEIDQLLRSIGKSLKNFEGLPQPPDSYLQQGTNNLIIEETSYNISEMESEFRKLWGSSNEDQKRVFEAVMLSVSTGVGGLFFVYGSGGCGKTYLWRTLISKLRSNGDIVLPVASSGIAATLMPGGRTAHSRFKIPIVLDDFSVCNIGQNSDIAELIRQTKLIIWDEAPMQHRYAFECLDRSLKDIMKSVSVERAQLPFGGITVVLGGDFRQILPVINFGDRSDIVSACITRSRLWYICNIFLLSKNMRLNAGQSEEEIEELKQFANWVLQIGDGKVLPPTDGNIEYDEYDVRIPSQFCDLKKENSIEEMIRSTYPDFTDNATNSKYLSERGILTPTNQTVSHLNMQIVELVPGDSFSYYSVDSAEEFGGTQSDLNSAFPIEHLNSISMPGMPSHELKFKVGVVVMLMRNLNQTLGLCNGTRLIITKCLKYCVEAEVICGSYCGTRHFIPRMELCPSDSKMPFKLIRKQMPLQVCYAMTINKSQGQSLENVGLFLPKPAFTHGQYYVAISRVTSPGGLKIFCDDETGQPSDITQNVVYKEVFYGLPSV